MQSLAQRKIIQLTHNRKHPIKILHILCNHLLVINQERLDHFRVDPEQINGILKLALVFNDKLERVRFLIRPVRVSHGETELVKVRRGVVNQGALQTCENYIGEVSVEEVTLVEEVSRWCFEIELCTDFVKVIFEFVLVSGFVPIARDLV
jgi:hypothetical protein